MNLQLISCLCITRAKPDLLKRAINCFLGQTYTNKELVIVYEDDDIETEDFVKSITDESISTVKVDSTPKLTLGALRNLAINICEGEYFCQWDDDDWFHKDRLAMQMRAICESQKGGCVMTNWIMHDELRSKTYFSVLRLWEGSIMCKTSLVRGQIKYPEIRKGEDTEFTKKLIELKYIFPLMMPCMYIYVFHGRNTWDHLHMVNNFYNNSQLLSPGANLVVKNILKETYTYDKASQLLLDSVLKEIDYLH
ncbi:MAG: glycosyltransferase family A protein [Chitinophagaceae bacterium]